eukprot:TRINITY_DN23165_c0_g1_i11.p1 TRINITY_DN23165_c0_g1~~TRINITY_DN23165_c0_g1_i11.p1  ORF type:complete len:1154 (+),score=299.42 TRINITY_DN23165_c0_g1_i11:65-3526(+)
MNFVTKSPSTARERNVRKNGSRLTLFLLFFYYLFFVSRFILYILPCSILTRVMSEESKPVFGGSSLSTPVVENPLSRSSSRMSTHSSTRSSMHTPPPLPPQKVGLTPLQKFRAAAESVRFGSFSRVASVRVNGSSVVHDYDKSTGKGPADLPSIKESAIAPLSRRITLRTVPFDIAGEDSPPPSPEPETFDPVLPDPHAEEEALRRKELEEQEKQQRLRELEIMKKKKRRRQIRIVILSALITFVLMCLYSFAFLLYVFFGSRELSSDWKVTGKLNVGKTVKSMEGIFEDGIVSGDRLRLSSEGVVLSTSGVSVMRVSDSGDTSFDHDVSASGAFVLPESSSTASKHGRLFTTEYSTGSYGRVFTAEHSSGGYVFDGRPGSSSSTPFIHLVPHDGKVIIHGQICYAEWQQSTPEGYTDDDFKNLRHIDVNSLTCTASNGTTIPSGSSTYIHSSLNATYADGPFLIRTVDDLSLSPGSGSISTDASRLHSTSSSGFQITSVTGSSIALSSTGVTISPNLFVSNMSRSASIDTSTIWVDRIYGRGSSSKLDIGHLGQLVSISSSGVSFSGTDLNVYESGSSSNGLSFSSSAVNGNRILSTTRNLLISSVSGGALSLSSSSGEVTVDSGSLVISGSGSESVLKSGVGMDLVLESNSRDVKIHGSGMYGVKSGAETSFSVSTDANVLSLSSGSSIEFGVSDVKSSSGVSLSLSSSSGSLSVESLNGELRSSSVNHIILSGSGSGILSHGDTSLVLGSSGGDVRFRDDTSDLFHMQSVSSSLTRVDLKSGDGNGWYRVDVSSSESSAAVISSSNGVLEIPRNISFGDSFSNGKIELGQTEYESVFRGNKNIAFTTESSDGLISIRRPVVLNGEMSYSMFVDHSVSTNQWALRLDSSGDPSLGFYSNNGTSYVFRMAMGVSGNLYISGDLVKTSSRTVKHAISDISSKDALNLVRRMQAVTYKMRERDSVLRIGYIAEELELVLPHAVVSSESNLKDGMHRRRSRVQHIFDDKEEREDGRENEMSRNERLSSHDKKEHRHDDSSTSFGHADHDHHDCGASDCDDDTSDGLHCLSEEWLEHGSKLDALVTDERRQRVSSELSDLPSSVSDFSGVHSGEFRGVSTEQVVPVVAEAVKELANEIDELRREIAELKSRLSVLS